MKGKKSYFYSIRKVMSYDRNDYTWRFIIGARGIGKSYQAQKLTCTLYHKVKNIPENENNIDDMFVWFRLKPSQAANMGDRILDIKLQEEYKIKVEVIDDRIYYNGRHMGYLLAIQDAPHIKGGNWPWSRFRYVFVDEFQLERKERRTFDVVYNLRSCIESVTRVTTRIANNMDFATILLMGNTVDEATDILFAFDFMPMKYGLYKIHKKMPDGEKIGVIIEYVDDGVIYKEKQKRNPLRILQTGNDFTFGDIQIRSRHNLIDPYHLGHKKFIGYLQMTDYIRLELWTTQKGYLYISKGLETPKYAKDRIFVLAKLAANKGASYNIEIHKLVRRSYENNNIYFDRQITARVFEQNLV